MSPLLQNQLAELTNQKQQQVASGGDKKRRKLVVVSQNCIEPLQALRDGSKEVTFVLPFPKSPFWINVYTSVA